jgi:tetratricopeptide (TPR) repeat protein
MFASLDKYNRDKIADAFLEVFKSSTQPATMRELAGEGLAQMGSARHQAALKSILANPNENSRVQERAVYTLARLGDRTMIDKMLKEIATKMEELKKPDMTAAEARGWASGFYRSAMLSQNIHDQDAAIKYYEQYVAALESIGEKNPQGLDGVFYNLACLYSLKGDVDLGLKNLDKAFSVGYENYKWANTDGDLANIRKDPRWKPLIEKWESGKKPAVESAPASRPA